MKKIEETKLNLRGVSTNNTKITPSNAQKSGINQTFY